MNKPQHLFHRKLLIGSAICALVLVLCVLLVYMFSSKFSDNRLNHPSSLNSHDWRTQDSDLREIMVREILNYQPSNETTASSGAPHQRSQTIPRPSTQDRDQLNQHLDPRFSIVTATIGMEKVTASTSLFRENDEYVEWLHAPTAIDSIIRQANQANRNWTFGWLQLARPVAASEISDVISNFDASVISTSGPMIGVRLPSERSHLESIRDLEWIQGLGVLPSESKISPSLHHDIQESTQITQHPIYITVMSASAHNESRQELNSLGVATGHFDSDTETFEAVADTKLLNLIADLDFVQAIEAIEIVESNHDSAVQAMGVDSIRAFGGTAGQFTGFNGSSVPIAVMDTGLNTNHVAISSERESICGKNLVPNEDSDLWIDAGLHGSHVTGTVLGNGYFQPLYAGMAPGVEHIRFAKVLSYRGFGFTSYIVRGMDYLAEYSACPLEGGSELAQKPLIVNMSLSGTALTWDGKETASRKVDSIIWSHRQLYAVAASNGSVHGYSNYGVAKNTLAVGASWDNGDIASFSSHGPTIDGRLLPNVVGTGVRIRSALGDNSYDGYRVINGTSMSSPAVAGVLALLMDASPEHRERPALTRARIMASAIRPDAWLDSPQHFPKHNSEGPGQYQAAYGMGFVSARTTVLNHDDPNGWISSGATVEVSQDEIGYQDIEVPIGTSRLDIVLTWDEPSASTIATTVLNDLDLWVDRDADCGSDACGEYSSTSSVDSVEWVIIQNPEPGNYRVKVSGSRVFTKLRAAVAWTIVRGDSTPQLSIEPNQKTFTTDTNEHDHTVELTLTSSAYVATGVNLYIDCRTRDGNPCESFGYRFNEQRDFQSEIDREDGLSLDQSHSEYFHIGEIGYQEEQKVKLYLYSGENKDLVIDFTVSAFNANSSSSTVYFLLDGSDSSGLSDVEIPLNDASTAPMVLSEREGVLELDMLGATTESGESGLFMGQQRELRSLWYEWGADTEELTTFIVAPTSDVLHWYATDFPLSIDVFEVVPDGLGITSLEHVGTSPWSVQWFPALDQRYRIRVSGTHATLPVTMSWFVGEAAANDNFANATLLSGESGATEGHNLGATIEEGEEYGSLAASIWYRWEAPKDGRWNFQIKDGQVVYLLIFSGDEVDDLRLVSGVHLAGHAVMFDAKEGTTYHIMVASPSANSGGWKFEQLHWEEESTETKEQFDYFEDRLQISEVSGERRLNTNHQFSVEANELETSGIQTAWLSWIAPEDGTFTWSWNSGSAAYNLQVFRGSELQSLDVPTLDPTVFGERELVFEAEQDQEYVFSIGRDKKDFDAFSPQRFYTHNLNWGLTPENNTIDGAILLAGTVGSLSVNTQFATTSPSLTKHGYSSLWYSFEATESGWYQFRTSGGSGDYVLTAFQQDLDTNELSLLGTSFKAKLLGEGIQTIIYVEEGETVYIRVGHSEQIHTQTSLILHWEETEAPHWLRYLGQLGHRSRDASSNVISLEQPTDIAINSNGTAMFVTTASGLSVFERDETTGGLTFVQELSTESSLGNLIWDPYRERLYVSVSNVWQVFKPKEDTKPLELELDFSFTEPFDDRHHSFIPSGEPLLLHLGLDGDYLYKFLPGVVVQYEYDQSGELKILELEPEYQLSPRIRPYLNGTHWLTLQPSSIRLLRREIGSGSFRDVSEPIRHRFGYRGEAPYVIRSDDVFTARGWGFSGVEVEFYSVNKNLSTLESKLSKFLFDAAPSYNCHYVLQRPSTSVVDIICDQGIVVVEFDSETEQIKMSDFIISTPRKYMPDRFGNDIPSFNPIPTLAVEESPDRRHFYVLTESHGILTFERIGIEPSGQDGIPEFVKRLDVLRVSDNTVEFGTETVEDGCLTIENTTINDVTYTITESQWQERDLDSDWSDIEGSDESDQVCSRELEETKEYRLLATVSVDGTSSEYASNYMGKVFYSRMNELVIEDGTVELDAMSTNSCMSVSALTLSGVKYSVETSQWQKRDDSEDEWSDIETSKKTRELCTYSMEDDSEYRLVGTFLVDEKRGYYHSNTITADD